MAKYRKKPMVIEAEQYHPGLEDGFGYGGQPFIKTLEGDMYINPTDWIITGIQGERYPCKDDIFQQTYDPVEDTQWIMV